MKSATAPVSGLDRRQWLAAAAAGACLRPGMAAPPQHSSDAPAATWVLGSQPLGVPTGAVSALLLRDQVLARQLAHLQQSWQTRPYRRGADMLPDLTQGRLAVALLGDFPTLMACVSADMVIGGLIKQAPTAVVARGVRHLRELEGRRIAYVPASSAHLTLMQGLALAQLTERQVRLVPLPIDEMTEALQRGEVDAIAAWEPISTAVVQQSQANQVLFRGQTSDYWVMPRRLVQREPLAARHALAGLVRAVAWMRRSGIHLNQAVRWAQQDAQAAFQRPLPLAVETLAHIVRRDLLDVPSAPVIPQRGLHPPLWREFNFLRQLGKVPPTARWERVQAALAYDGLLDVLANAALHQTQVFDYQPPPPSP